MSLVRCWVSILFFSLLFACGDQNQHRHLHAIYGYAFGTSYSFKYIGNKSQEARFRRAIDSLFLCMNRSMSTYLPESLISRSNSGDTSVVFDQHFVNVFRKAKEVYKNTNGFFDPTVGVLKDVLPFGALLAQKNPTHELQQRRKYIGFEKVTLNRQRKITKTLAPVQLDFNAIAKGYAVDIVARYMGLQGTTDFLIEVGGEVRAHGKNLEGDYWRLGVEKPLQSKEERALEAIVELRDESLATSGNYRKYYITKDGKKVVHTVNPKTGQPFPNNMRSASVIGKDCVMADAYATAFMAMGFEKSKKLLERLPDIEVFFLYEGVDHSLQKFFTPGFRDRAIDLHTQ